ncbi:UDP-N-acetylenolpyruvoylglucosamine reductase [Candidatus Nomurabacteria bacterium RIFCSPLOWO2_01_FULL_39_18]|uniref:UDP-N-acetylenolpyruvoylglucosamine reductase n=1 Tax=Candidatus Nomurabacteria bacterium RIFCSPHIGHO2_01_FULL_40_24b TaxID=1801739 RepID=A0A1F6V7I5_9BACT|nr:MAG: UDP-N-acetylenolpyruvoylglucosamine reductase [Candidatus Nomurabacteria bacterium RIFCSPHIGHO2_01_FULL_40_24b]OGI90760.1 MAG: UDP-N-acetylenolpyruvoylglucosamine reductase [Candidatus Nomurabacteria bacterium RIFCSPLOWO2_01_FULL_39_18]
MKIYRDYDLTELNTFGVSARAKLFTEINDPADLTELFALPEFKENKKIFLGGGSNVLFTGDLDGLVVLNNLKGIEVLSETTTEVLIRAMSGEIWHDLVLFAVDREYWGIENLAFIPGTVGAAPMQNVGAYGAELKNILENVETFSTEDGTKRIFTRDECELGYRDSIFKNELKEKYFIFAITLKLSKIEKKNISYKILQEYLEKNKIIIKSPRDISDAVTMIRKNKLPDPKIIGNAGSFFKNIFMEQEKLKNLLQKYPDMPHFREDNLTKIPSAWLIEQCGPANGTSWKGYKLGNVGVHERQALVIVNYGGASGEEIKNLAEKITNSVFDKFKIKLIPEVNLI